MTAITGGRMTVPSSQNGRTMMDLDTLGKLCHQIAADHGFWDQQRNFGEMVALAHSELSEALEAHRLGEFFTTWHHVSDCPVLSTTCGPIPECTCTPKPDGILTELMDCIIRCLDTAYSIALSSGESIDKVFWAKMRYNNRRQHLHGKRY